MAASGSDTVSVVERTWPITISGGIVAVYFLGPLHSFCDHVGAAGFDGRAVSVLERTRS
jgi:hypothetical protein